MASDLDLGILKVLITDKILGADLVRSYSHELFSDDIQKFAKFTFNYIKNYKTLPTKRVLCDQNQNDQEYINDIWETIDLFDYDKNEFNYDLDKLKKRFKETSLAKLSKKISDSDGDLSVDPDIAAKEIESCLKKINQLSTPQTYIQRTLKEDLPLHKEEYSAKERDPELGTGIMSHYSCFDFVTDGIKPAELVIIAGSTGSGKSMWLGNIAIQCWLNNNTITTNPKEYTKGYNILYFTLEMPYDRIRGRIKARLADIPLKKLLKAQLSQAQKDRLEMVDSFIETYPYEFQIIDVSRGVTIQQIEARYNEACINFRPDLVIIDYMGLMELEEKGELADWLKQSMIAGGIHEFTRTYSIPVITACQLNEPPKSSGKSESKNAEEEVSIGRIGRSKLILHHANCAIQIVKRKNETKYSNFLYQFIKVRDGECDLRGSLLKNFANASLIDIPYNPESNSGESESNDISHVLQQRPKPIIKQSEKELSMQDISEEFNNE